MLRGVRVQRVVRVSTRGSKVERGSCGESLAWKAVGVLLESVLGLEGRESWPGDFQTVIQLPPQWVPLTHT